MIISLISQKGGVGKSALARLLAVEVARAGWSGEDCRSGSRPRHLDQMESAARPSPSLHPEIAVEKFRTVDRAIKEAGAFRPNDPRRTGPCRTGRSRHGSEQRSGAHADRLQSR